jgi:hypothetical protein
MPIRESKRIGCRKDKDHDRIKTESSEFLNDGARGTTRVVFVPDGDHSTGKYATST